MKKLIGFETTNYLSVTIHKKLAMSTRIIDDFKPITFFQVFKGNDIIFSSDDLKSAIKVYKKLR